MTEQDARKYWRYNYTTDEYRRLARKWDEIKDKLYQPENIDTNLELRKVEALEQIAAELGKLRNSMMDSTNMSKKLLTVGEAQEILSIGRTRMFSLIATGQLRSILIGSSRRIPSDAVEEFVQELLLESNTDS